LIKVDASGHRAERIVLLSAAIQRGEETRGVIDHPARKLLDGHAGRLVDCALIQEIEDRPVPCVPGPTLAAEGDAIANLSVTARAAQHRAQAG
jgi:hypothetical protein